MAQGMSSALDDCLSPRIRGWRPGRPRCSVRRLDGGRGRSGPSPVGPALRSRGEAQKLERHPALGVRVDDVRPRRDHWASPKFIAAIDAARKVAATATTVLLTGESGTGKEVLARAIHQGSARADRPFVALNCAALPETLVESELFGHERGAFTGADGSTRALRARGRRHALPRRDRRVDAAVQAKLLRVLQERQYERVGGTATLEADVRLIAATNLDLERAVADGRFREDLYYRIAVFRIHLPTLRERGEDVLLFADHFVHDLGAKMERPEPRFSGEARELLLAHSWPGNVRELNAIERALILAGELIFAEHLGIVGRPLRDPTIPDVTAAPTEDETTMRTIAAQERRMILEVLQRTHGHKERAAAILGLTRFQLYGRLKRYQIEVAREFGAEQGCTAIGC